MKIDWKKVSKSEGYISLKKAMIHDIQKGWRTKKESYERFTWVINRAKHYAYRQKIALEDVLNIWEQQRDYWWVNYYRESRQPKLVNSLNVQLEGYRAYKKYLKKCYPHDPNTRKSLMNKHYQTKSKKNPARWSQDQKDRYKLMKKYL